MAAMSDAFQLFVPMLMEPQNNNNPGEVAEPHQQDGIDNLLAIVEETEDVPMEDADETTAAPPEKSALCAGVIEEMQSLLTSAGPSVRNGMAMRFALLLLVQEFRELKEGAEVEKDVWLGRVHATIVDTREDDTLRYWVGQVITDALAQAPWGLERGPDSPSSNTAQTVNSLFAAMSSFIRLLNTELSAQGVDLDAFEDGEEEVEEDEDEDQPAAATNKGKKSRKNPNARDNRGNHGHGPTRAWTDEEHLSLLKTWRDNADKQHKEKVAIHNATFRPAGDDRVRTREGLRQQMDKLVGLTPKGLNGRIDGKITELENRIAPKTT